MVHKGGTHYGSVAVSMDPDVDILLSEHILEVLLACGTRQAEGRQRIHLVQFSPSYGSLAIALQGTLLVHLVHGETGISLIDGSRTCLTRLIQSLK